MISIHPDRPISGVAAGQYVVKLIANTVTYFGHPWQPSADTATIWRSGRDSGNRYFWWRNIKGSRVERRCHPYYVRHDSDGRDNDRLGMLDTDHARRPGSAVTDSLESEFLRPSGKRAWLAATIALVYCGRRAIQDRGQRAELYRTARDNDRLWTLGACDERRRDARAGEPRTRVSEAQNLRRPSIILVY